MEVPGSLVGLFLAVVARRLAALTYLSVQGSHEAGEISTADMRKIGNSALSNLFLNKLMIIMTIIFARRHLPDIIFRIFVT